MMKQIGDILKSLFDNLENHEAGKYTALFKKWDEIIGKELAGHVIIKDVEQDRVLVEIDHPGFIQRFQMKERYFLKIIQNTYPNLGIHGFKVFLSGK